MLQLPSALDFLFLGATTWSTVALFRAAQPSKFAPHPEAAAVAFSLIASSSYLLVLPRRRTEALIRLHQAIMFAGTGSLYYAVFQAYAFKERVSHKPHMRSVHSYLGVAALGMLTMLVVNTSIFYLTVKDEAERRDGFRKHHKAGKFAGILLTLAVVTGTLGFTKRSDQRLRIIGSAIASMALVAVGGKLQRRLYKKTA